MGIRDWFGSPLRRAIDRGMKPGAKLEWEIDTLGEYKVKTSADAKAVCKAFAELIKRPTSSSNDDDIKSLIKYFFDSVEGESALRVMIIEGGTLLRQFISAAVKDETRKENYTPFSAMYTLAQSYSEEGTDLIARIARQGWYADDYWWNTILRRYNRDNPETANLFQKLSNPPLTNFIGISLLDAVNHLFLEGHSEIPHPFDNPRGIEQLERWLTDPSVDHFSYAYSAIVALPFLKSKERDSLIAIALDHPSEENQIEAAWAAGKLGRDAGIRLLAQYCTKLEHADKAQRYLRELGREDAIPEAAREPKFAAKAEFCQWLAHPNELGRMPDEVEIVDQRELAWPPEGERKLLSLVRYRAIDPLGLKDDVGVGMVGSITFCLFTYDNEKRPPEDVYALHCMWEMEAEDLAKSESVDNPDEYRDLLARSPIKVSDAVVKNVVELSPKLNYPQSVVAVAVGQKDGLPGHLVLDGPCTKWYPATEFPANDDGPPPHLTLKIHVGRHLLGFHDEPDRKKWLESRRDRSPQQIVADFRAKLQAAMRDKKLAQQIVGEGGKLYPAAFRELISLLQKAEPHVSRPQHVIAVYDQLRGIALETDPDPNGSIFSKHTPLNSNFEEYSDALVESGDRDKAKAALELFESRWEYKYALGNLAARMELDEYADRYLSELLVKYDDWCQSGHISTLARTWYRLKKREQAAELLVKAMVDLNQRCRGKKDRIETYRETFQGHRQTYLDLFPESGEAKLKARGIPKSLT